MNANRYSDNIDEESPYKRSSEGICEYDFDGAQSIGANEMGGHIRQGSDILFGGSSK